MLIDISLIPAQEPYLVNVTVPVDVPEDFAMTSVFADVAFDGRLSRIDGSFLMEGVMTATVPALCSSCLCETTYPVKLEIREVFAREGGGVDDWPVSADKLDLAPALRCNLITALPQRILCQEGCEGLCPVCGQDLNQSMCQCEKPNTDDRQRDR